MRSNRRSRTRHNALRTDLTVPAKTLDRFIDGIDDVLASHLELHRAAGAASALDAERARAELENLALARDAVLPFGRGVLDVPDDPLAVVDEGRRAAALVLKRRLAAVVLAGEDVAGVVVGPAFGARVPGLPRAAG